jgi:hypothetical protein
LGQLFKITLDLKQYVVAKFSLRRRTIIAPRLGPIIAFVAINPHMAMIQVQVGKNMVEDVLLDGGSSVNIMAKELRKQLRLPNLKLAPYTLLMADQTITKPVGFINDLKIHIHGIPYIVTFTIMKNNVLDFNYSMLLS